MKNKGINGTFQGLSVFLSMNNAEIPIYKKEKGSLKINELFSIKWKEKDVNLYKGIEKPHRHDYYSILFLKEGTTAQFIDFQKYRLNKPALLLMHPDQVHFDVETSNAKLLLITFKESLFLSTKQSSSWKYAFRNNIILLDEQSQQDFLKYLDLLFLEYGQVTVNEKVIAYILSAILEKTIQFSKKSEDLTENSHNRIVDGFKNLVETNALSPMKVSDYAKKLFISPGHLNDMVKQSTGRNAKALINDRRILEAKRLLFWTESSVQEVAWQTGFKDPAYFTRFFKKHTGILPAAFKKFTQQDLR